MGESRSAYRILVGKHEGRRSLGRHTRRREDNIKMDLIKVGLGHGLNKSDLGFGQMAKCCECGNELSSSIRCGEFLE
jgi:hypothetical protein